MAGANIFTVFDFHKDNCDALMLDYERSGGDRSAYSGQTDDQGRWSRTWVLNDGICFGIDKKGYPSRQESLAPDMREHVVELVKSDMLRVRVVDGAGKPLAGTRLKAAYLGHKDDYTTDAEGKATVVVPRPNRLFLSLIAYPEGYPPVRKWWRNDAGNELIPAEFTFAYRAGPHDRRYGPQRAGQAHPRSESPPQYFVGQVRAGWHVPGPVGQRVPDGRRRAMASGSRSPRDRNRFRSGWNTRITSASLVQEKSPPRSSDKIEDRTAVMVMKKGIPDVRNGDRSGRKAGRQARRCFWANGTARSDRRRRRTSRGTTGSQVSRPAARC